MKNVKINILPIQIYVLPHVNLSLFQFLFLKAKRKQ